MTYHNFIEVLNCKIQGNSSEGICYLSREREKWETEPGQFRILDAATPEELWGGIALPTQYQTHSQAGLT